MQETRTAASAADQIRAAGYEVATGVGKTGVVGVLRNGEGPPVMLRADMDALPVAKATGLPYASKKTVTNREGHTVPVSHMCSHDRPVTWLVGRQIASRGTNDMAQYTDGGLSARRRDG
jgi:metal-dependent amidase/aminoacylase/carboxypeptidase family protein